MVAEAVVVVVVAEAVVAVVGEWSGTLLSQLTASWILVSEQTKYQTRACPRVQCENRCGSLREFIASRREKSLHTCLPKVYPVVTSTLNRVR